MKDSAPNWLAAGFQLLVKIFQPSVVNHDEACWLVETAIRTRITSTSKPHASARIWKLRSPSGRRSDSARAAPAGVAGSARVAVLTTVSRSDLASQSQCFYLTGDLAELRCGHLVEAGRQRRVAEAAGHLLHGSEQVADVCLEQGRVVRVRLRFVDQNPRLIGDRVRVGARRPDRVEGEVRFDGDPGPSRGRGLRRGRDVVAVLVLDRSVGQ